MQSAGPDLAETAASGSRLRLPSHDACVPTPDEKDQGNYRYLFYCGRIEPQRLPVFSLGGEWRSLAFGLTYQGTKNPSHLHFLRFAEQQKIAAFLNWKTGQIDALIARKRELLEKLKEKRIAVITQAVTRGINPAVPMRDSGISWLGHVPEHWEVKRLRYCAGYSTYRLRSDAGTILRSVEEGDLIGAVTPQSWT